MESDLMVEDTVNGLLAILSTKWRLKEHHKHPTHTHSLHTYIHTYIHRYIHTYIHIYIHTYIRACRYIDYTIQCNMFPHNQIQKLPKHIQN